MDIEQKEREEQLFAFEKKYNKVNHGSYTIPKPFALSRVFIIKIFKKLYTGK